MHLLDNRRDYNTTLARLPLVYISLASDSHPTTSQLLIGTAARPIAYE